MQTAPVRRPLVYLAGPDVFYPAPLEAAVRKKKILRDMGMEGLFPLDNQLEPRDEAPEHTACRIAIANEALICKCDIVLANMEPWHGPSMDVGTAYEMGYGRALGKIVVGYTPDRRPFSQRVRAYFESLRPCHPEWDQSLGEAVLEMRGPDGTQIENFGQMADNLMLVNAISKQQPSVEIPATFDEAAVLAKRLWEARATEAKAR